MPGTVISTLRWHLAKDALPRIGRFGASARCLVTDGNRVFDATLWRGDSSPVWRNDGGSQLKGRVIAWTEWPKPPKFAQE